MKFMSDIAAGFKRVFANQIPAPIAANKIPDGVLCGLDAPGIAAAKKIDGVVENFAPAVALVVNQPTPVPYCQSCGQALPPIVDTTSPLSPVVETVPPAPKGPVDQNDDTRPVDWLEETRTDLPMRSPKRIAFLLTQENMSQTQARIFNDAYRYRHQRNQEGLS